MNVVWKRPDGFHDAEPSDFEVVQISSSAKIWLHKNDADNFPFRISGAWQDEAASIELNKFVNLLNKDNSAWLDHLTHCYNHSKAEKPGIYIEKINTWILELGQNLKGDQWEVTIMGEVLKDIVNKINSLKKELEK